jgi:hypothetical protein
LGHKPEDFVAWKVLCDCIDRQRQLIGKLEGPKLTVVPHHAEKPKASGLKPPA